METNMHNCPYSAESNPPLRIPPGATMVGRYHDDALAPVERLAFEQHLAGCPACAEELRQLSAIRQALRGMAMPTVSRQFIGELQGQWDHLPQLTVLRFVSRLTKIAAVVAVVAMGHLAYEAIARPASPAAASAPPAAWEQVAVAPDSAGQSAADEQPSANSEPQFAEFVVQDLGNGGGGR
ncbi:MAG TPA: zf-HC2 domain-containing protein [Tepidisphaeraceae bacterium]|nr:zf-HC2 domain-containing protein [Tepidisphaeraceae bacterium]